MSGQHVIGVVCDRVTVECVQKFVNEVSSGNERPLVSSGNNRFINAMELHKVGGASGLPLSLIAGITLRTILKCGSKVGKRRSPSAATTAGIEAETLSPPLSGWGWGFTRCF